MAAEYVFHRIVHQGNMPDIAEPVGISCESITLLILLILLVNQWQRFK
jgi:hypothetical protein